MKKFELVEYKKENKVWYAARCRPLGLSAYGNTKDEAVARLKKMFEFWVDVHMKHPESFAAGR